MSKHNRSKLTGDQIRISCDSGANIHSCHDVITTAEELGFDDRAAWDAASEEEKMKAVVEYFAANGHPEFYWEEAGEDE